MDHCLVYVSSATTLWSETELDEILTTSRRNNARLGISGMLLYKGGNVMQVLEGDETRVRALFAKIAADPRHHGLITVWDDPEPRQFTDWTMAFRDLNRADAHATPGYSEFLNTPLTAPAFATDPGTCQRLLNTFKQDL